MKRILLSLLLLWILTQVNGQVKAIDTNYNLLIGTYTQPGKSEGIYVYKFNSETGEFSYRSKATGIKNPSYLAVSKDATYVYAVSEVGEGQGGVSAFSFDKATGRLDFLNSASSGGSGPCYISVDDQNRFVFVANYGGGSLSAVPINANGFLGATIQTLQHKGSSINRDQDKPHVHATVLSPDNRFLFAPDLGTDKINIYQVDFAQHDPLTQADLAYSKLKSGSGPRHFIFHPNGKYTYVIEEITGAVTVFDYAEGKLNVKQTVTLTSDGFTSEAGTPDAADIHISPDGKFLYGSLRGGINELVFYAIGDDGKLNFSGRQSTLGKTPRNFAIDPTGNYLLVGNSSDDEVVVFKRDQKTGMLTPTGKKIKVGAPVCLKFVKIN